MLAAGQGSDRASRPSFDTTGISQLRNEMSEMFKGLEAKLVSLQREANRPSGYSGPSGVSGMGGLARTTARPLPQEQPRGGTSHPYQGAPPRQAAPTSGVPPGSGQAGNRVKGTCHNCGREGHWARNCYRNKRELMLCGTCIPRHDKLQDELHDCCYCLHLERMYMILQATAAPLPPTTQAQVNL